MFNNCCSIIHHLSQIINDGFRLNDDKDVEEEIDHKIIDDDEEAEIDAKSLDDSVRKACDIDLSFTQETILKFPEFFNGGQASNAG
jgi:hypothetical protein